MPADVDNNANERSDEVWRPVVAYEGLYEVSSLGRVRRVQGRPLRPATNSWGYRYVGLTRRGRPCTHNVHVLVAEAFLGPKPPGTRIGFRNGDRTDVRAANVYYATLSEILNRRYLMGRDRSGRYHPPARLDEAVLEAIRGQRGKVPQRQLAARYGISQATVSRIQTRDR